MITPFGPPNDDLDRLNTILDAQVTGKRAPATDAASDADALAATARLVSGQSLDAREHASPGTLESIWRNVMYANAIPESTAITGASPGAVRSSNRINRTRERESSTSSSWLSVAAVAVLLLGIIGAAWFMRGGNGDGNEPIRLAAVSPLGTPEASPTSNSKWLAMVTPEECTVEPMSQGEYEEIMRTDTPMQDRAYTVTGVPDRADAVAAATVAREHEACSVNGMTMQTHALESPYYVHTTNFAYTSDVSPRERQIQRLQHGAELSTNFSSKDPMQYIAVTEEERPDVFTGFAYRPNDAVQLADGRVALPAVKVFTALPEEIDPTTFALILTDESGEWRVDERVTLCVGECDVYRSEVHDHLSNLSATPEASPVATPDE